MLFSSPNWSPNFQSTVQFLYGGEMGGEVPVIPRRQEELKRTVPFSALLSCFCSGCCPTSSSFSRSPCFSVLFSILQVSSQSFSCYLYILPHLYLHCFSPLQRSACRHYCGMWGFLMIHFHVQVFEVIVLFFQWLVNGDT